MAEDSMVFMVNEGVSVAGEVMSIIAGLSATEIDGVDSLAGNLTNDMITKSSPSKLAKGVKITGDDNNIKIKMALNLSYGYEIPKLCEQVQEKVKSTIESMTGMSVSTIDIKISSVINEKD
ncbi:MAG: Asp23/Gls24 family envelope stress response protein [Lachnospiraceae bacterium]|nr:Asp23/Gls24 family envelope stress response protein [Lachnospiraceae bacterium]